MMSKETTITDNPGYDLLVEHIEPDDSPKFATLRWHLNGEIYMQCGFAIGAVPPPGKYKIVPVED